MVKQIVFIFLFATLLFAEEQSEAIYQGMGDHTEKSSMELMIQNEPEIKEIYNTCQTNFDNGSSTKNVAECVNDEFKNLEKDVQERITRKYFKSDENEQSYESTNITTIKSDSEDPAIANLKAYLYQRLQEALYGEVVQEGKKQSKVVDHKMFLDLYKSQVSKNIITSLTSYCLDSDLDGNFIIYDPATATCADNIDCKLPENSDSKCVICVRERNRQMLEAATVKADGTKTLMGAEKWQECIQQIQHICYRDDGDKGIYQTMDEQKIKHSQQRACEVTSYLKSLRQNLLRLSEIEDQFNENNKTQARHIAAANVKIYNGSEDGKTIDDMTSITSKEFAEKSNYEAGVKELQSLTRQCKEEGNEAACKKFLIAQEERKNLDQANAEYAARSAAMEEKIKVMKEEEIRDYFKDEGRNDTEINKIISEAKKDAAESGNNWEEALAKNIAKKYEEERLQVIKRINSQIENKTATNDEFTSDESIGQIDKIEHELASRAKDFQELIHFNNIVSGYLTIEGEDEGEATRNTASITRELNDSAFSQPANAEEENTGYFDKLNQAIQDTGVDSGSKQQDAVNVEVDTLNEKLLSN